MPTAADIGTNQIGVHVRREGSAANLEAVAVLNYLVVRDPVALQEKFGVFRNGAWYLDQNGNGRWNPGTDKALAAFGLSGDIAITGDWNGDGTTEIGTFRRGAWFLDANGNGAWDRGIDVIIPVGSFGIAADIPVPGDWNGDGITDVGVFRNGKWYLDANGNRRWDPVIDKVLTAFGLPEDIPVAGDWNGDGITEIGVFRNGKWYLDANGNGRWDPAADVSILSLGFPTDTPITGDWNGDAVTEIGVFRDGGWYLDFNGNGRWDPADSADPDVAVPAPSYGFATDQPVTGNW
jgi:hypothetical protein